ncbi:hypothetical protein CYY_005502 [Polysphondylium violaceum]|uniref:Pentatricopeptide repeat-containing protein n=1 Tax=Polysphondylium violaceum TaxID=133409 RepID=A0A8J4UYM6_9MYCE|nr:hypothetical protein CYY_005502 [Polysphondylium violaceum]
MTSLLLKGSYGNSLALFKRVSTTILLNSSSNSYSSRSYSSLLCKNKYNTSTLSTLTTAPIRSTSTTTNKLVSYNSNNSNNSILNNNNRYYSSSRYTNEFIDIDDLELEELSKTKNNSASEENKCSYLVRKHRFFETLLDEDTLTELYDKYFMNPNSEIHHQMLLDFFKFDEFKVLQQTKYTLYINVLFKWVTEYMRTLEIAYLENFLKFYRRTKNSEYFYKVLNYMERNKIAHNIYSYNITLLFYHENGELGKAYELAYIALDLDTPLNERVYISLLTAFKSDLQIVKRVHQRAANDKALGLNSNIYNLIAQIYIKRFNRMDWAMEIVDMLQHNKVPITINTMVAILDCHILHEPVNAYFFFKKFMVKHPQFLQSQENCECITPILVRGPPELFLDLVDHLMGHNMLSREFFNTAINNYAKSKNRSIIINLYNTMITLFKPDPTTLRSLVFLSSQSNSLEEVMYWMNTVKQLGFEPNQQMYGYTMRFLVRKQHYNELIPLLQEVRKKKLFNEWVFTSMIMYDFSTGDMDQLENDIKLVIKHNGDLAQITDLVIKELLMLDDIAGATKWLEKKKELSIKPTLYTYSLFLVYHEMRFNLKDHSEVLDIIEKAGLVRNLQIEERIKNQFNSNHSRNIVYNKIDLTYLKKENLDVYQTSKFKTMIMNHLRHDDLTSAYQKLKERESKGFDIDIDTYYLFLKFVNKRNDSEKTLEFFKYLLGKQFLPEKNIITKSLDLIFSLGKKRYEDFLLGIPESFARDFEELLLVIRVKWDFKQALQMMMNNTEKYSYLFKSPNIRNAMLRQLAVLNEFDRASKLMEEMITSKQIFEADVLDYFYRKIAENEYYCPTINRMKDYYHRYKIQATTDFYNAQLSNLYLENRHEEAFQLFHYILKELKGVQTISTTTLELGMKIYTRYYPVPPLSNISKWEEISIIAQENKIRDVFVQLLFYRALRNAGQTDIIRENIKGYVYTSHIPNELALLILECCETDQEVIHHASQMIKKRQRLSNIEIEKILRKANETVRDPIVEKHLRRKLPNSIYQGSPLDAKEMEFLDEKLLRYLHRQDHLKNSYQRVK